MIKIALITEGVTDQFVIKPIIENYYKDEEFRFTPIPDVDETDKQAGYGGWVNVLNYCKDDNLIELFDYNDFVVIQIDADISEEKGFGVPHSINGKQIESEILLENILEKLQFFISEETLEKYTDRFLFAIGIYSIECWLVAIVNPSHKSENIQNCLVRLNSSLSKKNIKTISPKDKNNFKSQKTYKKLASQFKNKKHIDKYANKNVGFEYFVKQINSLLNVDNDN